MGDELELEDILERLGPSTGILKGGRDMDRITDTDAWAIWELDAGGNLNLCESDGFCDELEQTLQTPITPDSDLHIARFMRGNAEEQVIALDNASALPGAEQHMFTHLVVSKCRDRETGAVTGARAVYMVVP